MAQQTINIGTVANDGTGDPIRDAFDKANDNFTELYTGLTGLLDFKGSTDCSANPNYPAASKGDFYLVSVAGKIGGASGIVVEVGDTYFATADNAGGTQAGVGTSWTVVQGNITSYMPKSGGVFTGDIEVPAEAYGGGWNGSNEAPTKNDVYDKIESVVSGSGTGDVVGPASAIDNHVAVFDSTTGKLLKDGGVALLANGANITPAAAPATNAVGYLGAPQNLGLDSGNVTLALTDCGKSIDHTDANARDLTIPANGSVAFPVGTIICGSNEGSGIVTMKITTDTLRWGSSTGQRSIAQHGSWTIRKVTSTVWRLTGDGIT